MLLIQTFVFYHHLYIQNIETVNLQMQAVLRDSGGLHMATADHQNFLRLYAERKLAMPGDPGHVIAALSLRAPKKLSGQFVSWDSDDCKEFRMERM